MPFTASKGKTVTCSIYACGDTTLYISSCYGNTTCVGDTNLRLSDQFRRVVASNDDSCGLCSVIAYSIPKGTQCQLYNLRQGCFSFSTCGGTVQYTLDQSPTLAAVSPVPLVLVWSAGGSLKYLNGYFKGGFSFTNSDSSPPIINSVYYGTYMKHGTKYQW